MRRSRLIPLGAVCVLALLQTLGAQNAPAAKPVPPGDWPMYRRDTAGTGHSPLTQITTANVTRIARSWTYRLQTDGAPNVNSQATPIVIGGTMYVPAGDRVVALDAATGAEKWRHVVTGGAPSRRGVGYWPGDGSHRRPHHLHRRPAVDRDRRQPAERCPPASARTAKSTWAFRTTRCRSSTTTWSSSARTRRRGRLAGSATRAPTTRAPVRSGGSSARCRSRARSATTRGRATAGRIASARTRGRSTSRVDAARGTALHSAGVADSGRLGRRSRRREPVRQLRRRRRPADRQVQVALPDDSPRSLGCRSAGASGALRRRPQRQAGAGAGADDEVGLPLPAESRDWPAAVRRRGARRSRRATFPARRRFPRSRSR